MDVFCLFCFSYPLFLKSQFSIKISTRCRKKLEANISLFFSYIRVKKIVHSLQKYLLEKSLFVYLSFQKKKKLLGSTFLPQNFSMENNHYLSILQEDTLYQCRVYDDRDRVVNGTKPLVTEIEIPVYVAEKFSDTCSEAPADGIQWPRTKKVLYKIVMDRFITEFGSGKLLITYLGRMKI